MDEAPLNAITDTDALRALIREQMVKIVQHQEVISQHELTIARRDHEIVYKTAKICRNRKPGRMELKCHHTLRLTSSVPVSVVWSPLAS